MEITPALPAKASNAPQVQAAAKQFESMFMSEMLNHMYEGVETDGPFGGGHGEEVFRSMMIQEYGNIITNSKQFKLSDQISREMLRMQEEQRNPRNQIRGGF
jgi:flagellar protein FlgJ